MEWLKVLQDEGWDRQESLEKHSNWRNTRGVATGGGGAWGAAPPLASEAVGNFLNFVGKSRNFLFS